MMQKERKKKKEPKETGKDAGRSAAKHKRKTAKSLCVVSRLENRPSVLLGGGDSRPSKETGVGERDHIPGEVWGQRKKLYHRNDTQRRQRGSHTGGKRSLPGAPGVGKESCQTKEGEEIKRP